MYYEVTVKYGSENGTTQTVRVMVENATLFADAEYAALAYANENCPRATGVLAEPDVTAIKRSRVREFANLSKDGDKIYFATLEGEFAEDGGKVKRMRYTVALWAKNTQDAGKAVADYMRQGMDGLTVVGINETKIAAVVSCIKNH